MSQGQSRGDVVMDRRDGVAVITLDRQAQRNALSQSMIERLAGHLAEVAEDASVGAVVLTGAGRAFCTGGDFEDMVAARNLSFDAQVSLLQRNQRRTVGALWSLNTPVVVALNGAAAGAGLGLALAGDFRVGSASTVMATAYRAVGLSGDYGVTWLLNNLIGPSAAARLLMLNEKVRGAQARDLGLVDELADDDAVMTTAVELAGRLAEGPVPAMGLMRANLREVRGDLLQIMDAEAWRHVACKLSPAHRQAVSSS